ncbi:MAG: GNAT family N-acetyltransferase [Anaerolineae bacterium]|nr:GNAT family N-acetyltransferase [Anaerolineae bacterium]
MSRSAGITVRPVNAEDIAPTCAWMVRVPLWQRYGLAEAAALRMLEAALAGGDLLLAADHDERGARAGFAWGMPRGAFGRSPYLRLIGVRPDCTDLGIGAALLDAVEDWARAEATDLFLLVSDFNADAQRFYARHGYVQIGAIPGYVLPDVTEILMRKQLN